MKRYLSTLLVAALTCLLGGNPLQSAEPRKVSAVEEAQNGEPIEALEFFRAIEEERIEVRFIPKDATQATMIIKNKGDQAVNVLPPAAFGAVHVLGQMGMGGMGMGGMGMGGMGGGMGMGGMGMGGMGGGMGQGMGGGMGMGGMGGMGMGGMGGGMGMGGMGMGGGMFRIAPDRPTKLTVPCVCLEHGKLDPTPRMTYKVVPIEQVNSDPRVAKLCSLLGQGLVPQNTAQAAAWHMANGLSWDELAVKNRIESRYTGNVRFFSRLELQAAYRAATSIDQWVANSEDQAAEDRSVGYAIEE